MNTYWNRICTGFSERFIRTAVSKAVQTEAVASALNEAFIIAPIISVVFMIYYLIPCVLFYNVHSDYIVLHLL